MRHTTGGAIRCSWCDDAAVWEIRPCYGKNYQYACDLCVTDLDLEKTTRPRASYWRHERSSFKAFELPELKQKRLR